MKLFKKSVLAFVLPAILAVGALTSCQGNNTSNTSETTTSTVTEIALGSSVLGNWEYQNATGGDTTSNGCKLTVFVDSETKFHFNITKDYETFATSTFTFEGQITAVEQGVAYCFPVFVGSYLNHGNSDEDALAAVQTQFSAYKEKLPDYFDGDSQFQITFHRLSSDTMDNGYITVDNTSFDITFGVFEAVEALSA